MPCRSSAAGCTAAATAERREAAALIREMKSLVKQVDGAACAVPAHFIHWGAMVSGSSGRMEPTNSCMPSTRVARSGNRRR